MNGLAETHFLPKDYIRLVPPAKAKPQRLTTLYLCLQRCIQHPTTLDAHQLCPSSDPEKERKKENKQAVHIPIHQEVLSLPIQGHEIGEFLLSATLAVLPSSAHSLQSQEKKVEMTRVGQLYTQMKDKCH